MIKPLDKSVKKEKKKIKEAKKENRRALKRELRRQAELLQEARLEKKYGNPLLKKLVDEQVARESKKHIGFHPIEQYYEMYKDQRRSIRIEQNSVYASTIMMFISLFLYIFFDSVHCGFAAMCWLVGITYTFSNLRVDMMLVNQSVDKIRDAVDDDILHSVLIKHLKGELKNETNES